MTSLLAYHVATSAMRMYRIPNSTTSYKGKTVLGFEAGEGLPAWIPPARDAAEHDDGLRALVDLLPETQRHVISSVFFGQATLRQAAQDAGISAAQASNLQSRGLETLRGWMADPLTIPSPKLKPWTEIKKQARKIPKRERCSYKSPWGACKQPADDGWLCPFHLEVHERDLHPDPVYHRKVVRGEIEPIQAKLSQTEMDATLSGRYKGDGRRLDNYTGFDPIELDP